MTAVEARRDEQVVADVVADLLREDVGPGDASIGDFPLDVARVARWIEGAQARLPGFGMVRAGEMLPPPEICRAADVRGTRVGDLPCPGRIARHFREGYSLVISSPDAWDPDLDRLCVAIARRIAGDVNVVVVLSPPAADAFPRHQDDEDSVVIQLAGAKSWSLGNGDDPPLILRPGDTLVVPAGTPHLVRGVEGVGSLHITIGRAQQAVTPQAIAAALKQSIVELADELGDDLPDAVRRVADHAATAASHADPDPIRQARESAYPTFAERLGDRPWVVR